METPESPIQQPQKVEEKSLLKHSIKDNSQMELFKVYLMDGSYKVIRLDPSVTTVEELWERTSEKLMLTPHSAPMFFLWGHKDGLELLLYTHQRINEVLKDWQTYEDRYNLQKTSFKNTIARTITTKTLGKV